MKRRSFFRSTMVSAAALFLLPLALTTPSMAQGKPALTISAAASMKDALTEINNRYSAATVSVNYGASGALQRQIEQGAPVDVFISAAAKNMDDLAKANLVDAATRRNVAANRLVLVVPSGGSSIDSFTDLNKPSVKRFAMGAPESVPAGKYAQEVLSNLKIYDSVFPKAILGKDVREVLTQVELGNVDAGIVYKTDALTSHQVKIVATAPAKLHKPIIYPAAVVSDSKNKPAAAAYVRFLASPTAKNIFKKYGFLAPKK
ncbi:molybdate-binding protein ModA [Abditibacteriota bacterium]|nr:molybdate-binding protein ModA [Abditibacteriota bacterium]